jgi:hypothetical protein
MSDPRLALGADHAGGSAARVLEALDGTRVVVRLAPGLAEPAAAAGLALVSMVGRLLPHIVVDGDAPVGPNPWAATSVTDGLDRLAATRPVPTRPAARNLVVAVGPGIDHADLWIGGEEWTARVGRTPQPLDPAGLGLGLQAAATLAAAEVAKQVLGPLGMAQVPLPAELVWNLLDYQRRPAGPVERRRLRPVSLAVLGAGSVGSSVVGVLACLSEVTGRVVVVDDDAFDPARNPYRYPASTGGERGPKAIWLAGILEQLGWQVGHLEGTVAKWVAVSPTPGFNGIAVASVDTPEGRLQVADVLAETTLSIGVDGLALHLQREHLGDGLACPFCDFVDLDPPITQAEALVQQTGLPVERVLALGLGGRLTDADVAAAVGAGRVNPEQARELVGRRLADLIRRAYAEATIQTLEAAPTAVSAPYVSWMGGVLAAAEIAKAALGLPMVERRVDLDLTGLPPGFVLARPADRSGRCVCASPIRRRWMARLYPPARGNGRV